MTEDEIAEVGVDGDGALYLEPRAQSLPDVYRSGAAVGWDVQRRRLFSPKPRPWSCVDRFARMLEAAEAAHGVRLRLAAGTVWSNVPRGVRMQIEAEHAPRESDAG